jgi:hypothetical protein
LLTGDTFHASNPVQEVEMRLHLDIQRWLNWRALLVGSALGLIGAVTLWADMRIPQFSNSNVGTDVRELFVILGAWFGGPLGGLLSGAFSAIYSPAGDSRLHFSTWIAHALAGFSLGLYYKPGHTVLTGWAFSLAWIRAVLLYYLVLLVVVSLFIGLLVPAFITSLPGPEGDTWQMYLNFWFSALPELAFVLPITLLVMMALPHGYRKPLWDVDKPLNP